MRRLIKGSLALLLLLAALRPEASPAAPAAAQLPEPILTRQAATPARVTLDLTASYFEGVLLEEARNFDGLGFELDLTIPLGKRSRIEFLLPFYTEGEALAIRESYDLDIEGNGGIFEYPTILFIHQLLAENGSGGLNLSLGAGFGYVFEPLEARYRGALFDRYNHSGKKGIFLLGADKRVLDGALSLFGNLRVDVFFDTDDINPSSPDTGFVLAGANLALRYDRFHRFVFPALEISYTDDLDGYHNLLLVPELLFSATPHFQFKLGLPLQLTGDGEEFGARFQLSVLF